MSMITIKQVLRETTKWEYTNHDYILGADGKCVAFRKAGDTRWQQFKKPLMFSKKGRSFQKLKEKPEEFVKPFMEKREVESVLTEFMS